MPQSVESNIQDSQPESSDSPYGPFQKKIVLYENDPRVITLLMERWTGDIKRMHFDDKGVLTNDLSKAVLNQTILFQDNKPVVIVRQHAKVKDKVVPNITLFASSSEGLELATQIITSLFKTYEQELHEQGMVQAEKIDPDTLWQTRMEWIIRSAMEPGTQASRTPQKFVYTEPKLQ